MSSSRPDPNDTWNALLARARSDTAPPLDAGELLRELHRTPAPRATWRNEFSAIFDSRIVVHGCLSAAGAVLGIALWRGFVLWSEVAPWLQIVTASAGHPGGGAS